MASIEEISDLSPAGLARFDDILDVRSPAEFAEDRIPGAINLPVLSNEERAEVGRTYVQESRFLARRMGAALVTKNISQHLSHALKDKPADYRPLIYCWRGGMRSNAMATIFLAIGWRAGVVAGGYKTWRRRVVAGLGDDSEPFKILLIDGQTGAAKTDILNLAAECGAQGLDLEALAEHRGSAFGGFAERAQPAQKLFESLIFTEAAEWDPARPVLVEAESSRIGSCFVPARLWKSMKAAPRIEIRADARLRARHLVETYGDLTADRLALSQALDDLRRLHGKATLDAWRRLADAGDFEGFACRLIEEHYDAVYNRSRKRRTDAPLETILLDDLTPETLRRAAQRVVEIAGGLE